ncbi:MAG TPA: hypothetical protein VHP38_01280 [Ruminiclostridium sp.]|nr:hypothetical protein [Ruminiclostridium sp.]
MKINFYGSLEDILPGLEELLNDVGLENTSVGFPVEVRKCNDGLKVQLSKDKVIIENVKP